MQFVTSVRSVKHVGAKPSRIVRRSLTLQTRSASIHRKVLADVGLHEEQRAKIAGLPAAGIPLELKNYTHRLKALSTLPGAPYLQIRERFRNNAKPRLGTMQ